MTEQELKQENEKLNARLQKAVTVFNDQKAQIKRLTEERDAAIAKTSEANKQDELFFEQQNEIETLKSSIKEKEDMIQGLTTQGQEQSKEIEILQSRIDKAGAEFTKQKELIDTLVNRNNLLVSTITKMQDLCKETIDQM